MLQENESKKNDPIKTIPEAIQVLREGFKNLEQNRVLLKRRREFGGTSHILEWEPTERPAKIPRVKIPGFKEWYSFEIQTKTQIEASRPSIRLESVDRHPYFRVRKTRTESEDFKIRVSHKQEKRSTVLSLFRERRAQEIQVRRGISTGSSSLRNIVCHFPIA